MMKKRIGNTFCIFKGRHFAGNIGVFPAFPLKNDLREGGDIKGDYAGNFGGFTENLQICHYLPLVYHWNLLLEFVTGICYWNLPLPWLSLGFSLASLPPTRRGGGNGRSDGRGGRMDAKIK